MTSHVTAPVYPANEDASAFSALTSQQPAIQPNVAMARIGPNSFFASANRAKMIVASMLDDGAEQMAWSWISESTSHGFQPNLIAVLASAIAVAVATANPRKTLTGDTWRSAIAPKTKGDTNAPSAAVAKAYGLIAFNPWASRTVLNGTSQIPRAAPWMKNRAISSAYSARRIVLSTRTGHTGCENFQVWIK